MGTGYAEQQQTGCTRCLQLQDILFQESSQRERATTTFKPVSSRICLVHTMDRYVCRWMDAINVHCNVSRDVSESLSSSSTLTPIDMASIWPFDISGCVCGSIVGWS